MTISDVTLDDSYDWDYDSCYSQEISLTQEKEIDPLLNSDKSFAQRVQLISEKNKVGSFLVDSRVLVKGPSDFARVLAANHWELKRDGANWWGRFDVCVCVSSVALGLVGIMVAPWAALAGAVSGVAMGVLASWNYKNGKLAQNQLDKWNRHPAQDVVDLRANTYDRGFFYCLDHNLKGSYGTISPHNILHPNEVTWLYEQSFENMMKDVTIQMRRLSVSPSEKREWIEQFVATNPLSLKAISYAYASQHPKGQILEAWSTSFNAYKQDVSMVQNHFSAKSAQIRNEAKRKLDNLQEQRKLALALPDTFKWMSDDQAKQARNEQFQAQGASLSERENARRSYQRTLRQNENLCKVAQAPINMYYNKCEEEVRQWEGEKLEIINQEKNIAMAPYFTPALDLFAGAYESWKQDYSRQIEGVLTEESLPPPFSTSLGRWLKVLLGLKNMSILHRDEMQKTLQNCC